MGGDAGWPPAGQDTPGGLVTAADCGKNKLLRDWTLLPGKTPTPHVEEAPDRPPRRLGRWRSESYSGSSDLSGFTVRRRKPGTFKKLYLFNYFSSTDIQTFRNKNTWTKNQWGSAVLRLPTTVPSKHTAVCTHLRSRPKEKQHQTGVSRKNKWTKKSCDVKNKITQSASRSNTVRIDDMHTPENVISIKESSLLYEMPVKSSV